VQSGHDLGLPAVGLDRSIVDGDPYGSSFSGGAQHGYAGENYRTNSDEGCTDKGTTDEGTADACAACRHGSVHDHDISPQCPRWAG
jgi:hypothetical protein